ncbi:hypothetical protein RM401_000626 [Enterobacter kobei]|nr:hypothetical protein [Enterobacter kobei]
MINLSKTTKFQITIIVILVFLYIYRSEFKHSNFEDEIPIEVTQCLDGKLGKLLSSSQKNYEVVDLALKSCEAEVNKWLKSYTANPDEYGMTYSYLRDYYISQIQYSRQPETSGQNHS